MPISRTPASSPRIEFRAKTPAAGREIRVHVRGTMFAGVTWGSEDLPCVIALHGWMDNADSFSLLGPMLDTFRVVALDLAGHGHSGHRPVGASYTDCDHAADVVAIADALSLDRFVLLGHSLGGGVASLVAGAIPKRVVGLVSIEALGVVPSEVGDAPLLVARAVRQGRKIEQRLPDLFDSMEDAVEARMRGLTSMSEQAVRLLVPRGLKETGDGYRWRWDSRLMEPPVFRLTEDQVRAFLRRIQAPVRVILADRGLLRFHEAIRQRSRVLRDGRVIAMRGGHHLHLEQSAREIAMVVKSLRSDRLCRDIR